MAKSDKGLEMDKLLKQLINSDELAPLVKTLHQLWRAEEHKQVEPIESSQSIEPVIERGELPVERVIVEKTTPPDWAIDLEEQRKIMLTLADYPQVQSIFLIDKMDTQNESTNILRFISISSNWETVVRVWEDIAEVCKQTQNTPDIALLTILTNCIKLYNLTLTSKHASLLAPEVGEGYNYNLHHKVAGSNDQISKVLLPALYSPSDELLKSSLVIT